MARSVLRIVLQQEKWSYDADKNLLIPAKEERRMIPFVKED